MARSNWRESQVLQELNLNIRKEGRPPFMVVPDEWITDLQDTLPAMWRFVVTDPKIENQMYLGHYYIMQGVVLVPRSAEDREHNEYANWSGWLEAVG